MDELHISSLLSDPQCLNACGQLPSDPPSLTVALTLPHFSLSTWHSCPVDQVLPVEAR